VLKLQQHIIDEIIKNALKEDLGTIGDITTDNLISDDIIVEGEFVSKEEGILAGIEIAERVFNIIGNEKILLSWEIKDGEEFLPYTVIGKIKGPALYILKGERVALNFLQRLSGIATKTRILSKMIGDYRCRITDTRKTTPGLRVLEKYAVFIGGGVNHRFGLYDAVLIKDNHIKACGGIYKCVTKLKHTLSHVNKIEVEAETLEDVEEALKAGADIIMLDNMDIETMKKAVAMIKGKAVIEASGNINEYNLKEVAAVGVDYISIGALTHSYKSIDISLKFR